MYCQKCGKKNLEDARFCMHCGADLSGYKVEISPKIEVSPKISVSAKAEGGVALKWKLKPIKYAKVLHISDECKRGARKYRMKEGMKLPVYNERDLPTLNGKLFCPLCGNYDCLEGKPKVYEDGIFDYEVWGGNYLEGLFEVLEKEEEKEVWASYYAYYCLACDHVFLTPKGNEMVIPHKPEKYLVFDGKKIPVYNDFMISGYNRSYEHFESIEGDEKRKRTMKLLQKYKGERILFLKNNYIHILKGQEKISKFIKDVTEEKILSSGMGDYRNFLERYTFCPKCKEKKVKVVPTSLHYSDSGGFGVGSYLVDDETEVVQSLLECGTCGKFLIVLKESGDYSRESIRYAPRAYPFCEFCDNAAGIYTCSVCGKRICESCTVTEVVKKGLLSKKSIKVCPNCAKEK